MNMHLRIALILACAAALGTSACHRNIVSAAPPSVAAPPPPATMPQPLPPEPAPEVAAVPAPEPPPSIPATPEPVRGAIAPRPPAEPAAAKPRPEPEPESPQISPQMTGAQLADAQRRTTDDIRLAEGNLQRAYGKQLNASQHDLVEKITGFLAQAHEAVRANDWVRARNLAEKAQVLSLELVKSL
jgi:hypothetical protein